ncbi:NAD-binding protein [Rathayibacter sp. AY1A7]|uniref:NAD-binding protein n=1 Tax=Rathayibacter sp. AY1A7 TaxID=2080524 RepID=UPI0011B020F4|nr:NAD-binding protein [Rathayibacter sp. AY1A7]
MRLLETYPIVLRMFIRSAATDLNSASVMTAFSAVADSNGEVRRPQRVEQAVAGDYSPSFALALMQKDAGLIQAYADSVGAPVPGVATARHYIDEAMAAGFGGENASALIKAIAAEADVDLTRR